MRKRVQFLALLLLMVLALVPAMASATEDWGKMKWEYVLRAHFDDPPSRYRMKVKDIGAQANRLRELFPELGAAAADERLVRQPLPKGAEGWFAIPRWEIIGNTYGEAVDKVLTKTREIHDGKFFNFRDSEGGTKITLPFDPDRLRRHPLTAEMLQRLGDQQKGYDILVVPAQLGLLHSGRSIQQAHKSFAANEFGLGTFEAGIILLTHPERLSHRGLWVDCAGDEFSHCGPAFSDPPKELVLADFWYRTFECTPHFKMFMDQVRFSTDKEQNVSRRHASVSAFLPQ